jgi:TetR/AcrR family transcriptional regulator, regulator of autoinduction and epiphytic fitness
LVHGDRTLVPTQRGWGKLNAVALAGEGTSGVGLGDRAKADFVDPRVERSRELVLAATLDLLAEVGYGNLTIEAVAARSGVAKSTIYRHWSGKLELVSEAFNELKRAHDVPPPPGPIRQRVTDFLREIASGVKDPTWRVSCLPALIDASARDPDMAILCRQLAEKGAGRLIRLLDEAVEAGELPEGTDTELLADALTGPILLRALFHRRELDPDEIPALVDQLLPS